MTVAMTETIPGGPEAFLESLREELSPCAHSHHVSFAAVLAERRMAWAGENVDWEPRLGQGASMRQIMEAVWSHACGRDIAPDRLGEFEADLTEVATLVDPDRYAAFDAYRAIWLLRLTVRCCATGAGVADAVTAARASLYMSADSGLSEDYVSEQFLRERWNVPKVQAEARLQSKLARTLRAMPRIAPDAVEALRRDFVT
jgi:uncharacterized protein YjaG (DUF416 family)